MAQLNEAIARQQEQVNTRPFKKLPTNRRDLFESVDKPAMKPLPTHPFEYSEWKKARVNIDYHVEVDHHYYSVPYHFVREQVDVRLTATSVEVLFKGRRIASHKRNYVPGAFTTLKEHMPKSHQRYLEWTPSRIIKWAAKNGPNTEKLVTRILEKKLHPEQGFRSALGIIRLENRYSPERVERACQRALFIGAFSYQNVKSILKNGLDQQPLLFEQVEEVQPPTHHNVRGKQYYHGEKETEHAQ
jgi:transposase